MTERPMMPRATYTSHGGAPADLGGAASSAGIVAIRRVVGGWTASRRVVVARSDWPQ